MSRVQKSGGGRVRLSDAADTSYVDYGAMMRDQWRRKHTAMPQEEQLKLIRKAQAGDNDAMNQVIEENLALALQAVNKYNYLGEIDDLGQEAYFALRRAVELYDPDKGAFSTYAYQWMHQRLRRYSHNNESIIRLPVNEGERAIKIARLVGQYKSTEEAAEKLLELGEIQNKEELYRILEENRLLHPTSLDVKVESDNEDNDTYLIDMVASEEKSFEDTAVQKTEVDEIREFIDTLKPTWRDIMVWRYGLDGDPPETLEQISARIGVTRERVRQIENRSLLLIRRKFRRQYTD